MKTSILHCRDLYSIPTCPNLTTYYVYFDTSYYVTSPHLTGGKHGMQNGFCCEKCVGLLCTQVGLCRCSLTLFLISLPFFSIPWCRFIITLSLLNTMRALLVTPALTYWLIDSLTSFMYRGSSSDKIFTVLLVLCAVAGFLGSVRWHAIGDATHAEALLW